MIVITLTDCPPALRGDLSKWLQEISTGVYVGQVNARVRDELWKRVKQNARNGRATMVYSAANEQKLDFRVHNTSWEPIDFDGLKLILRPSRFRVNKQSELNQGFSKASQRRIAKQMAKKKRRDRLHPQTYIVLDVETTGLSFVEDEIIELGAILVNEGIIEKKFQSFVKASKKLPPPIEALTGITKNILEQEGRELIEVLPEFLSFVSDFPVVSHNADFDYGFLRAACQRFELPKFSNRYIDTLELARRIVDNLENYKLSTLLEYFNIEEKAIHRSIEDCLRTHQLYTKLIEFEKKENEKPL